jgi:hypothetical protein
MGLPPGRVAHRHDLFFLLGLTFAAATFAVSLAAPWADESGRGFGGHATAQDWFTDQGDPLGLLVSLLGALAGLIFAFLRTRSGSLAGMLITGAAVCLSAIDLIYLSTSTDVSPQWGAELAFPFSSALFLLAVGLFRTTRNSG